MTPKSSILHAVAVTPAGIQWPAPPFFKLATPLPPRDLECDIQLANGRVLREKLVEFEPGAGSVVLRRPPHGIRQVGFGKIRCIKLTQPINYIADTTVLLRVGATEGGVSNPKPFEVCLADGSKMTGTTLGFVQDVTGLFLFIIAGDAAQGVINCFIPAVQIKDVQVGPLLGEMLVEKHAVSADALAMAMSQQAALRSGRVGTYLAQRAIISAEQLTLALQAQEKRPNVRLGEILIEAKLITEEQLGEALRIQAGQRGRRIGEILIEMGAVSMRLIQFAMSDKLGIPYVNVREFKIGAGALEAIDTAFAIRYQVLPLLCIGTTLVVAVEDPLLMDFTQELRLNAGMTIAPVIANPPDLKARIAREYSSLDGRTGEGRATADAAAPNSNARSSNTTQAQVADLTSQLARETQQSVRSSREVAVDSRVTENTLVKLINKIIIEAHGQGASDIHIEASAGRSGTRIRLRKDGDLENYLELPQAYSNALVSRIKVMAELDISEHRHPQDGKIDFGKHGPLSIELRVAVIPTANNLEDIVLRILGGVEPLPLDQVGFSSGDLGKLTKMIARSYGLILVCGPTGSGKTTTLHSVLREINRPDVKIWTAEDPIEITQPGLRQVQVHPKIGWTFAAAMRAFLRADPDVIMVGEMRDAETTKIGIEASLTGHLVFSTLHTNSAAESVVRLLDLGMDAFNFADALIGILSQRLARKLCQHCKQAHVASATEIAELCEEYCNETKLDPAAVIARWRMDFGKEGQLILRRPAGCDACKDGYKGRVVVYELLTSTPQVKYLIRTRGSVPELFAAAQEGGMLSLRQHAIEKVLLGVLDVVGARTVSS